MRTTHAAAAALLISLSSAFAQTAPPPPIEALRVTRTGDNGEGSLRWAIERNNTAPGRFRIEIDPEGAAPFVIKPASLLPPIKGPVRIEGMPWRRTGELVALDGSGFIEDKGQRTCAGATDGQFGANVRTTDQSGPRGRRYPGRRDPRPGNPQLLHRRADPSRERQHGRGQPHRRQPRRRRRHAHRRRRQRRLDRDDHDPQQVQRNEFIDNGDGLELTRGAAFNLIARNIFRSTNANPEPSQGIEILLGHDNVLVNNRFEGYSDGIQVNGGNRNYIGSNVFTDNALALSMTGEGNVIDSNTIVGNAVGVALRPAARMGLTRVTRNIDPRKRQGRSALLVRWQLRSKAAARRHHFRRAGAGARGLCRRARRRRAGRSVQAHENLPRGRARMPGPAQSRHRGAGDRKGRARTARN